MKGSRLKLNAGELVNGLQYHSDYKTDKTISGYRRKCYFVCYCGNVFNAILNDVKSGHTKSCGCKPTGKIVHGMAKKGNLSPEFVAWQNMIDRCYNPSKPGYKNYGGRGISVCDRWRNSFECFLLDMGLRPSDKHSLDRYPNNNGDYEKSNCRWATKKQQANNTRRNVCIEYNGKKQNIAQWSLETGVHPSVIAYRVKSGLPPDKILFKGHLQKIYPQSLK